MKHLKRLLIVWAVASNTTNVQACGSYLGPEGYRIGLFLPYTYYKPWLGMLQYDLYTSVDPDISLAREHDRDLNCLEWKNYCHGEVKKADIYFVMYEMPPGYFLQVIDEPLDENKTEAKNTFIRWMLKPKNEAVLRYMKFAKSCETISMQRMDPWDEDMTDVDELWGKFYDDGYKEMVNCEDPFLAQRWAFQFNRRHAYGAAVEDNINGALGQSKKWSSPSSLVEGWNCAYTSKFCGNNIAESNALLAKAFDLTQDKKYYAVKYFVSDQLSSTLSYLQGENEAHLRAVVYGLAALNQQDECMNLLRGIMQNDVNSEVFELALTREIQKIEDQLMTEQVTGFYSASGNSYLSVYYEKEFYSEYTDKKRTLQEVSANSMGKVYFESYAQMLLKLIEDLLNKKQLDHEGFFHLAAAHLNWCLENKSGMKKHITSGGKLIGKKNPLYVNLCIERSLLQTLEQKGLDAAAEQNVYEVLQYLDQNEGYDVQNLRDQFCITMGAHYEKSGDLYKSTLLMPETEGLYKAVAVEGNGADDYTNSFTRYFAGRASLNDADEMMNFLHRGNYTPFEAYLAKPFARDSAYYDLLMEWVGSTYLRNEKWEKALYAFEKIDKHYWEIRFKENDYMTTYKGKEIYHWTHYPRYLDANPFSAKVSFNHSGSVADTVHYNKLTFTKKWLKLQQASRSSNRQVRESALLQIAHARYNMTWYGNSWVLWRNEWSAYEDGKYWPGFEEDYYACAHAREAYQYLYNITQNPETKARCCVMLAVCDRNKAYYINRNNPDFKYKGGQYLDLFMKKFQGSEVHEKLMSTCMGEDEFLATIKYDE